ncbi:MAG: sodium:proton antiporter [Bacteroidaceae bacterium]|nr:sodium:proton antiporter [Bacteroidaceae bacterium]
MKSKKIEILLSLVPVVVLIILLATVIRVFGSASLDGGSQVALLVAAGVCTAISILYFHIPWKQLEEGVKKSVGSVTSAIIILLMIGAISGVWILSGVVPTLIHYGLMLIHPKFFLVTTCIICAIVSVLTGSSWSTIATIGIALLGIGQAQGFSSGLIAGAIISGAYFGDKMSPLSDTTVLASTMSEVPLFSHIRYMMYTVVPTMIITLIIFTVIGLEYSVTDATMIQIYQESLQSHFNLSPWLMIVPVITLLMIAKRWPAVIVLFLSSLLGALFALLFQPHILAEVAGTTEISAYSQFTGVMRGLYDITSIDMGHQQVSDLVATRGMTGMLNTIYLILCAMCFGGLMTTSGMLQRITSLILPFTRTRTSLVASTVSTGFFMDCMVADQYLSIILTANMFKGVFKRNGYEERLLSRSIEDSATVTSPLIPWSSCGMTQATILGVPTLTYLPYCFFNIISPLMSITVAAIGYKIYRRVKMED